MTRRGIHIAPYDTDSAKLTTSYRALKTEDVLPHLSANISPRALRVLDVGAGSGRDAAWMAEQGATVTAVEPARGLREAAARDFTHLGIRWLDDRLPDLKQVCASGEKYDLILLSAVWMHFPPEMRAEAFDTLARLLAPQGKILLTLRHGPTPAGRLMFPVSVEELQKLAEPHFMDAELLGDTSSDKLGRGDVWWQEALVSSIDDAHGTLAAFCDATVRARKSGPHKLAVGRCLSNLAQATAQGTAPFTAIEDNGKVKVDYDHLVDEWMSLFPLATSRYTRSQAARDIARFPLAHMTDPRTQKPLLKLDSGRLLTPQPLWKLLQEHGDRVNRGLMVAMSAWSARNPHQRGWQQAALKADN
ncbi:MAG: class I SAM-dependent methyltransferase [Bdellovibrionales bacterium]